MRQLTTSRVLQEKGAGVAVSQVVGLGRSLIALGQLSVFLFSDLRSYFVPVGDKTFSDACNIFPGNLSFYCGLPSVEVAAILQCIVLMLVISGLLPRYTCLLHAYVSLSFIAVLALPDGGDLIASTVSVVIVFVYIGDPRLWHWGSGREWNPVFQGISCGAQFALKVQVAFIYANSALAKFAVPTWADGSQMYYVTCQEMFGGSGWVGNLARSLTEIPFITLVSSWGTIAFELAIVVLLFVPKRRAGLTALVIATLLHAAIIVLIGLFSFGVIMMGAVMVAVGSRFEDFRQLLNTIPRYGRSISASATNTEVNANVM